MRVPYAIATAAVLVAVSFLVGFLPRLLAPPQWATLTDGQSKAITAFVAADRNNGIARKLIITVTPGAPTEAMVEAYSIMWAVQRGKNWRVSVRPYQAFDSPTKKGFMLGVRSLQDDPEAAQAALSVTQMLRNVGYANISILHVRPDAPPGAVVLTVGRSP